ncbi:glycosyltransferase family 69 protein [Saccharata proteae CBS 121410]|uniref:Glycosyltransferase family 69 protein n=1 Tax=Saccharata proteae CBS 121410 TaxID=1314787 RepID=A0A9P4I1K0_9PEZI|nr:glycosyltransferase family 69 protein [Saccharata proteae CBS 121410]
MLIPRRYTSPSRLPRTLLFDLLPLLLILWTLFETVAIRRNLQLADAEARATSTSKGEKIFISSVHLHDEPLLRQHWNAALIALTQALGPANVYVSIYESNSLDDTKGALKELDAALGEGRVRRTVELDHVTRQANLDEALREDKKAGFNEPRRIPYLARLRNRTLRPMTELEKAGEKFDKVLFLNDVVFTPEDVLALLNTNKGHYAAACALDFKHPPAFYDSFALRDIDGREAIQSTFPYFASHESRSAIKAGSPVPVRSCWNGMIVFDATPYYTKLKNLRFRSLPDNLAKEHLEASECCLIHADNPYSDAHGVFVNPAVRVGYDKAAYDAVNPGDGWSWVGLVDLIKGTWVNRLKRWFALRKSKEDVVQLKIFERERKLKTPEPGAFCAIDEMQVLRIDGWAHV